MKKLIIPKQIVTVNSSNEILHNSAVEIEEGTITRITDLAEYDLNNFDGQILKYPSLTLIPGFVQTHIHTCQTLFRGMADDMELLDWLKLRIFPLENAHSPESLRQSVKLSLYELQSGGTTTILDMGTMRHQEIIFEEFIYSNMRGYSGKCMIDRNDLYPEFKESTEESIKLSLELAETFHMKNNSKVRYAFAPRFVLSCSEKLLSETGDIVAGMDGTIFHSHSSENKGEIEEVRKMYGKENIEYFDSINILGDRTVLAHCIHVNDEEVDLLKNTRTRVAHCPSANLKLGSGIADIPKFIDESITVSLGADGAPCNNNLSAFTEMRLASLIQKPIHGPTEMDAKTVFRLATIEGAKALHLEDEIGSIEAGKKADLVLLSLEEPDKSLLDKDDNIYSNIVYSSNRDCVKHVMIEGNFVVEEKISKIYNKEQIVSESKEELIKLLKRI